VKSLALEDISAATAAKSSIQENVNVVGGGQVVVVMEHVKAKPVPDVTYITTPDSSCCSTPQLHHCASFGNEK